MKNKLIQLLDSMAIKSPRFSKLYVHSDLKGNRSTFAKKDRQFDTLGSLNKRFEDMQELASKNDLSGSKFKKLCLGYYNKNFYLTDYYMYLINMNQQKLAGGQLPKEFQVCLESETLLLRQKLLLLVEQPHLNRRLNDNFTKDMVSRATPSLVSPDIYLMSLLKNKVYGDRWYDPLKTKQANAQTLSEVKVHSMAQRKPAFRRRLQNTKRYDSFSR